MPAQHSQRARLSSVLQLRLLPFHHTYLAKRAELDDLAISAVLREVLETQMVDEARALDEEDGGVRAEVLRVWLDELAAGEERDGYIAFVQRLAHESHARRTRLMA